MVARRTSRISVDIPPPRISLLSLDYEIRDAVSGIPLLTDAEVSVRISNRWFSIHEAHEAELRTGAVYWFRFDAPGYYRKEYSLLMRPRQSQLQLRPNLAPLPGAVSISSEVDGVELLIDGMPVYVKGGPQPKTAAVPVINAGTTEILMPPGTYQFSIAGHSSAINSLSIPVKSQRRKVVYIRSGNDTKMEFSPGPESIDRSIGL